MLIFGVTFQLPLLMLMLSKPRFGDLRDARRKAQDGAVRHLRVRGGVDADARPIRTNVVGGAGLRLFELGLLLMRYFNGATPSPWAIRPTNWPTTCSHPTQVGKEGRT